MASLSAAGTFVFLAATFFSSGFSISSEAPESEAASDATEAAEEAPLNFGFFSSAHAVPSMWTQSRGSSVTRPIQPIFGLDDSAYFSSRVWHVLQRSLSSSNFLPHWRSRKMIGLHRLSSSFARPIQTEWSISASDIRYSDASGAEPSSVSGSGATSAGAFFAFGSFLAFGAFGAATAAAASSASSAIAAAFFASTEAKNCGTPRSLYSFMNASHCSSVAPRSVVIRVSISSVADIFALELGKLGLN